MSYCNIMFYFVCVLSFFAGLVSGHADPNKTPSENFKHSKNLYLLQKEQLKEIIARKRRSAAAADPEEEGPTTEDMFDVLSTEEFRWVEDVETLSGQCSDHSSRESGQANALTFHFSELYRLQKQYDYVKIEKFGKTYEKRDLLAIHINKNNSKDIVFLTSLIHAREWVAGSITMNIIHRLLKYNTKDARLLRDNFHFIIVPCLNPDGYEYTMFKNRMWRKNREPIPGSNFRGVDLNRNFLYGYRSYPMDHENYGAKSEIYSGGKALSALESTALSKLLFKYRAGMKYFIDYHTYGNLWLSPYGAHNWLPRNEHQIKRYRDNALRSFQLTLGGQDFVGGSAYSVLYECHGILMDHVHYYVTPLSFTVEVGDPRDDFTVPDTRINTYTISQWLALASQLKLLKKELKSGQYEKDRTLNWRRTKLPTIISSAPPPPPPNAAPDPPPNVSDPPPPNVLMIVVDDMGYGDAGFRGSDIPTPTLDLLAEQGVVLENHYVMPQCGPTRAALMSGRHSIVTGTWHGNFQPKEESGLPLEERTMGDMFKDHGYDTHAVGKWHLGMFKPEYTPLYRGFDTFLGLYTGTSDHFTHENRKAYDLRYNFRTKNGHFKDKILKDMRGVYSTNIYVGRTVELLNQVKSDHPWFIYCALQVPHAPYIAQETMIKHIEKAEIERARNKKRVKYAAMILGMDEGIRTILDTLDLRGFRNNTVVVVTSDNGAVNDGPGSNYPLRGGKRSFLEGGVRALTIVRAPGLLSKTGYTNTHLHHVTDWLPTFEFLAAGRKRVERPEDPGDGVTYGVNIWPSISDNLSCRDFVLINIKRQDKFKGTPKRTASNNRPPPPLASKPNNNNNEITDNRLRPDNDLFHVNLYQKSKSRLRPGSSTSPKYFDAEKFKSISERLRQIYHHKNVNNDTVNETVNDRSVKAIRVDRSAAVEWPPAKAEKGRLDQGPVTETLDEMATVDGTEVIDVEQSVDVDNMIEKGTEIVDDEISNETEGGIEETPEEKADETPEETIEEPPEEEMTVVESGTEVIDEEVEIKSTEIIDEDTEKDDETKEEQGTEVMDEDDKATEEIDDDTENETIKDCKKDNSCKPKPVPRDCENETEGCKDEDEEDEKDGKTPGFRDLAVARYSHWKLIIGYEKDIFEKWTLSNGKEVSLQRPGSNKSDKYVEILYELKSDPREKRNVADKYPKILKLMKRRIEHTVGPLFSDPRFSDTPTTPI
eukprot:sb/3461223/